MRELNVDEGGEVFLENNYKGSIRYAYPGKSPGRVYFGVVGQVGGSREEIRFWVL